MWGDPDVVRHIGGRTSTREDCWGRIQRYVGHWALLGFGFWAVIERASGRYVGEVGFADFQRACEPPLDKLAEGGWVLATWAHGRGFATEALRGALAWDGGRLARQRTQCVIDPGNDASARVAARCGYLHAHDALMRTRASASTCDPPTDSCRCDPARLPGAMQVWPAGHALGASRSHTALRVGALGGGIVASPPTGRTGCWGGSPSGTELLAHAAPPIIRERAIAEVCIRDGSARCSRSGTGFQTVGYADETALLLTSVQAVRQ